MGLIFAKASTSMLGKAGQGGWQSVLQKRWWWLVFAKLSLWVLSFAKTKQEVVGVANPRGDRAWFGKNGAGGH